jgi:type I restriction enzyme M protein
MAKKKGTTADTPKTTAQQLGTLIKSARDIMRKDKGLNGDLDRLPLLTWIMFLKFLDDREKLEEARAGIGGKKYVTAVEAPYRWRDWAANKEGITGDSLTAFVNQDEAVRSDGKRGPGLLAYLRSLRSTNGDRRRDVIATVFDGVINRMISGYLMRDVINLVNGIHFDSSEEIHTLARLYESMLREMRDAAGDSGEFYTPRPVIQFMVAVTDPKLGEVVLDPACGTGGFLAEAFAHLEQQCKTVQDRKTLQEKSIRGGEAKPLPYMLSQMNLLLHGLDAPAIEYGNSLAVKITELGPADQVDVILTNPPFGGEEETGIRSNFPADKQTSETALLFLQLIMRRLKKPRAGSARAGRAAIVVPNGTLSGDGVCARIKEELLKEFNLHTIVRLPNGVFTPYTPIPTNLMFFDRTGHTKEIWVYEVPLPDGRKNFSKTKPLQYEDLANCVKWFQAKRRKETDHAWRVPATEILKYDSNGSLVACNLDLKNPNNAEALEHLSPERLVDDIMTKERRIIEILEEIRDELAGACK